MARTHVAVGPPLPALPSRFFSSRSIPLRARADARQSCNAWGSHLEEAVFLPSARESLERYRPLDGREQAFQARMLSLLDTAEPWSRTQYGPGHLTSSAFVLSPDGAAVLLIFHRKLGIWIQPGGHIEPADGSLLAAAQREVSEEVGVTLEDPATSIFDVDIHAIPARKAEPQHEHFDVRFCLRARSLTLATSDEVVDARWVPLSQVAQVTADESVLRAVRKLRAHCAQP